MRLSSFAALGFVLVVLVSSCAKKEPERPQLAYPYSTPNTYPASAPNPGYAPYGPAPAPAPQGNMTPAAGFPCRSDQEFQCPFGRCINGRCGGCSQVADCKSGAVCVPTWLGASCWPGGPVVSAPAPPPQASPMPAPAPAPAPVPPVVTPPANPGDPFAAARDRCVQLTNMYRARVGAAAVSRDASSESCADNQSAADARRSVAHANFGQCREFAQNTCPNYPGASLDQVMTRCFQQMFDEGPGGGHYDNMTNRKYTRVFCGFAQMGNGRWWVNQDFR